MSAIAKSGLYSSFNFCRYLGECLLWMDTCDKKAEALGKVLRKYRSGGMDEILPNLYCGSYFAARDVAEMKKRNIKHVICCLETDTANVYGLEVSVYRIAVSDSITTNMREYFHKAVEFIHLARSKDEGVLVHCLAGVSRSVTIVAAYLMTITELGFLGSLGYIIVRHHCASPNSGFRIQLNEYAKEDMQAKRLFLRELVGAEASDKLQEMDLKATNLVMTSEDEASSSGAKEIPGNKKKKLVSPSDENSSPQKKSKKQTSVDSEDGLKNKEKTESPRNRKGELSAPPPKNPAKMKNKDHSMKRKAIETKREETDSEEEEETPRSPKGKKIKVETITNPDTDEGSEMDKKMKEVLEEKEDTLEERTRSSGKKDEDGGETTDTSIEDRGKKRRSDGNDKESKKRKSKEDGKGGDAYAIRLGRLKKMVIASGLRFNYKKMFDGLDNDKQRVKKLEEEMHEKGISAFTLEGCRAFKLRREEERELGDISKTKIIDIGAGDKVRVTRALRAAASTSHRPRIVQINSSDSESEPENTTADIFANLKVATNAPSAGYRHSGKPRNGNFYSTRDT